MFNNLNNNYNLIIDTSSNRNNKRKLNCVICYPKVQLELVNEEEFRFKCPRCKNDYQILDHGEGDIIPEEDELISSHDDNVEPIIFTANEDYTKPNEVLNEGKPKSDIKVPKYMQDSDTTKVTYYQEN